MRYMGRPKKYNTAKEMQKIIVEYFNQCREDKEVPTVTGLGFALNMSRQDLLNYENCFENGRLKSCSDEEKQDFVDTIKRAKQFIQAGYEQGLFNKNSAVGSIFTLKNNYSWVDKQEIEQTNKDIIVSLED